MIARKDIEAELDCAQQISGQLEAARQARGLSKKEVAYQLMLSADQVNCLENRSLKSFYSSQYYVLAAKKYAAFLGVTIAQPQVPEVAPLVIPVVSSEKSSPLKSSILVGRRSLLWAFAALVIILVGLVFVVREGAHDRDTLPVTSALPVAPVETVVAPVVPAAPVVPVDTAAAPVVPASPAAPMGTASLAKSSQTDNVPHPATPSTAPPSESAKTGTVVLQLNFTAATWVSTYRRDGAHEQKVYGPEDTLKLDLEPLTELIIGNAPATRLSIGKNKISLKRFTSPDSNVARVVGQNLRDLGQTRP